LRECQQHLARILERYIAQRQRHLAPHRGRRIARQPQRLQSRQVQLAQRTEGRDAHHGVIARQ
jgi:hypothetical protein